MPAITRKVVLKYLYDQLTGNFMGFVIGMSATSVVSHFFETRSLRNLWGLTSKKTVIDKDTFANLEWIIAIVLGFVVFEIMTKVVKERMVKSFPSLKTKVFRWIIRNDLRNKRVILFAAVYGSVRNSFSRFSKS